MVEQTDAPQGETLPELAARFERSDESLRVWLAEPGAPEPTGLRATSRRPAKEYDPDEVAAFLRRAGRLPGAPEQNPAEDPLMTLREAAGHAGIAYSTARAYVAGGQWPEPDEPAGTNVRGARWRRSSIDKARAGRKRMA